MPKLTTYVPGLVLLALAGCGESDDSTDAGEPARDSGEAVFDAMTNTLDESEAVEEQSLQQKARLDAALEQMEAGEPPERR